MVCYVMLCYAMYVCMDMCQNVHIHACMHAHAHMDILELRHGVRYGWIRMDMEIPSLNLGHLRHIHIRE